MCTWNDTQEDTAVHSMDFVEYGVIGLEIIS
jgi:hypothetical protein